MEWKWNGIFLTENNNVQWNGSGMQWKYNGKKYVKSVGKKDRKSLCIE